MGQSIPTPRLFTYRVESTDRRSIKESLIIRIHLLERDAIKALLPVIRVVFPHNGSESKSSSNGTNAIVDIAKGRLLSF